MALVYKTFLLIALSLSVQFANACTWDSDCDTGYHCNEATKKCTMGKWPDGGCTWDSDCVSGYVCQSNSCAKKDTSGCTWDSDCATGYQCASGKCKMGKWPDGGCTWDSDCQPGYECENNECQSTGTAEKTFIQHLLKK